MSASLASVAYHEAGHAVAAWRIGAAIESVTADPGEGCVVIRGPRGLYWREYVRRRLLMLYAGPEAQRLHDPSTNLAVAGAGDYADAEDMVVIAHGAGSPLSPLVLRVAERRARDFVRRERAAIEAVAAALVGRRHLDGPAIAVLMRAADQTTNCAVGPQG